MKIFVLHSFLEEIFSNANTTNFVPLKYLNTSFMVQIIIFKEYYSNRSYKYSIKRFSKFSYQLLFNSEINLNNSEIENYFAVI